VRLSRPQAALLDGPRALRGLRLPPASRLRRRSRGHRRHRRALPRLLGTGRAGRRDSSRRADDKRPADAATRIRPLVHLERIRTSEPLGAAAPHSRLTPCQPSSHTDRRSRTQKRTLGWLSGPVALATRRRRGFPYFQVVTSYDPAAFDAYESAGWEGVAAAYE